MKDITIESGDNLYIWNEKRTVPAEFLKTIGGGRLKGMSDISPQWRLQAMTEMFGPIGVGWYYDIDEHWTEDQGGEVSMYVKISLFIKVAGEWSKPIVGVGGNMLLEKQKAGPFHNDECLKGAVTDAISVAAKQLGIAADVYLGRMESKYSRTPAPAPEPRNLDAPIAALRAAKTVDELKEVWHKVNLDYTGDHVSLGVLTAVKDKAKNLLSVTGVFGGEVVQS